MATVVIVAGLALWLWPPAAKLPTALINVIGVLVVASIILLFVAKTVTDWYRR